MKITEFRNADVIEHLKTRSFSDQAFLKQMLNLIFLKVYQRFKVIQMNGTLIAKSAPPRKRSAHKKIETKRIAYGQGDIMGRWKHFLEMSNQFNYMILQTFSVGDLFLTLTFNHEPNIFQLEKAVERYIEKIHTLLQAKPIYCYTIERHDSETLHVHMLLKKPTSGWFPAVKESLSNLWIHGFSKMKQIYNLFGMAGYMTKQYSQISSKNFQRLVDRQIRPFHKSSGLKLKTSFMSAQELRELLLANNYLYLKGRTLQVFNEYNTEVIATMHSFVFIEATLLNCLKSGTYHKTCGYIRFNNLKSYAYLSCYRAILSLCDICLSYDLLRRLYCRGANLPTNLIKSIA